MIFRRYQNCRSLYQNCCISDNALIFCILIIQNIHLSEIITYILVLKTIQTIINYLSQQYFINERKDWVVLFFTCCMAKIVLIAFGEIGCRAETAFKSNFSDSAMFVTYQIFCFFKSHIADDFIGRIASKT